MNSANIEIKFGAYGLVSFVVNGADLTAATQAVNIDLSQSGIPVVTAVFAAQSADVSGDGIVKVPIYADNEVVKEFLDNVDVRALEADSLDSDEWGEVSPGEVFLNSLKRLCDG